MCGATTVAMSWQLQLPCSCDELPSRWIVVAMSHEMQLPCCVNSTCQVIAVQKKCRMVTTKCRCHGVANQVAMWNALYLPCASKYSCHDESTSVATCLPKCQKCSMATKKCRTWCIKSTCHVITQQLPSQVRTPKRI